VAQGGSGQGQLSDTVRRQLAAIFTLVSEWRKRTQAVLLPPAAGSSLSGDDEVAHPCEPSHAVGGALVSAADHMDALRALVQDAHVVHARAPFTLLRAALENSATAVWLLAPANRNERILRRLRLQWADSCDLENAALPAGAQPPLSRAGWKDKLEAIARARSLPGEQAATITGQLFSYGSVVKTAASEAQDDELTGEVALLCWMAASGIAHARLRAALSSVLDRPEVPGAPQGAAAMKLSASDKALAVIAGVTTLVIREGWRLAGERGRSYRQ
jgi:hypothetical protein